MGVNNIFGNNKNNTSIWNTDVKVLIKRLPGLNKEEKRVPSDPRDLLGAKNATKEAWIPNKKIILPDKKIIVPDKKVIIPEKMPELISTKGGEEIKPISFEDVQTNYQQKRMLGFKDLQKMKMPDGDVVLVFSNENIDKKKGIFNNRETMTVSLNNSNIGIKRVDDYEHNSTTSVVLENPLDLYNTKVKQQITQFKDKDGNVEREVKYENTDLKGVFNITEKDFKTGKINKLCEVTKNEDGGYSIVKNLVSLDGTVTKSVMMQDATGNHSKLDKTITDKDGNILSQFSRTYDRVSDELAYSSVNNHQYKIENTPDKVTVTDLATNKKTKMDANKFVKIPFFPVSMAKMMVMMNQKDKAVVDNLFNKLPGDALVKLSQDVKYVTKAGDDLESYYARDGKFTALNCVKDLMVVNHELGHAHDIQYNKENPYNYSPMRENNEDFQLTYESERKAFIEKFPDFEESYIDYFIFAPIEQKDRGKSETVAETNAINGLSPEVPELLAMRTIYLEQYFPKTIAKITNAQNSIHVPDEVYDNQMSESFNQKTVKHRR